MTQTQPALFVPHGAPTFALRPGAAGVGRLYEMLEGQVAILSAGLLDSDEAVALLRARDDIPPVTLDIYGTGTDNFVEYLRSLIESHGLADSVHMHGFAPQTELAAAFAGHDLYLFCSTWDEPFSGGLLEAVCSGIPTIATTTGGSPEAVRHEENGLLVPPGDAGALADAVVRFMHDPELYGRVGACAGSEVAARWSFDAYLDRIEGAYEAIVAGHCPGAPVDISGPAQQAGKEPA